MHPSDDRILRGQRGAVDRRTFVDPTGYQRARWKRNDRRRLTANTGDTLDALDVVGQRVQI
jgi:hypothetical protein